jgi:cholesterol transport system auxiliary component
MKALTLLAAGMLAGCALGPVEREAVSTYDFGPPPAYTTVEPRIRQSILVQDVITPAWLHSTGIVYRLAYRDPAMQRVYANSRWAAAPGGLIGQRLRSRLAAASTGGVVGPHDGARADYALRIEIDDFSQVFDTAEQSRGAVVARASLFDGGQRTLAAQKTFKIERTAGGANAAAGVEALGAATEELVEAVADWVAASASTGRK